MVDLSDSQFETLIARALDELPKQQVAGLNNVSIVTALRPNKMQTEKLHLRGDTLLLGLYEGIPLTQRTGNYSFVLPDVITLFKDEIKDYARALTVNDQYPIIKHTLWHEIAHFYGLDHPRIHEIEQNWQ